MQERSLLKWFIALNAALAGAFVLYLFITTSRQPKVETVSFAAQAKTEPGGGMTNVPVGSNHSTNETEAATNAALTAVAVPTNPPPLKPVFTTRKFTWKDVETSAYRTYLDSLRAVGCPEDRVRSIVLADIDELFAQRRVAEAVSNDPPWWKAEPTTILANTMAEKGRALENQRVALIEKLLGSDSAEAEKSEPAFWNTVQLTGKVLGSLSPVTHNEVQEICARAIERSQSAMWARFNEGQPLNQVEMAKLREQTRSDLRKVLTPEEQEEFLLRYSHVAHTLRYELRGLDPTPDEFRKIFRAVDPIDHSLQLEYGGPEALSPQQRERYERQRDEAIRGALSPERYQAYLLTKDPLYRQAQMTAMQYGAPVQAIMPLYQFAKSSETKRQQILTDARLNAQQKSAALQAWNVERQQGMQRIVFESVAQRRAK